MRIDATPGFSEATVASGTAEIYVATSNPYGYTLNMGASGTDASSQVTTSLARQDNEAVIQSIASKSSVTDPLVPGTVAFADNSWGVTTDNNPASGSSPDQDSAQILAGTYLPISTANAPTTIKVTSTSVGTDKTNVTFTTKVDGSLPSGTYTNTVIFTATVNPSPQAPAMQDFTATECANLTGDTILRDNRDDKEYTVRKLDDDNCWMVQNLRLDGGATITSSDSDITAASYTLPSGAVADWSNSNTAPKMVNGSTDLDSNWTEAMGNYYNWTAAIASNDSSSLTSGEATTSICPKGWKLPSGNTNGDFWNLASQYLDPDDYEWNDAFNSAFPLTFSGDFWDGSLDGVGDDGSWWSRAVYDSNGAYRLGAGSDGGLSADYYDARVGGFSVRCVFAP